MAAGSSAAGPRAGPGSGLQRGVICPDRRRLIATGASLAGGALAQRAVQAQPGSSATGAAARSAKRGVAYDLASRADIAAVSAGAAWWYNWAPFPNAALPAEAAGPTSAARTMAFVPMLWNGVFDAARVVAWLRARPAIRHLLVLNEPNLVDQANHTPAQAAAIWPSFEAVAAGTGTAIVGPALTWGTLPGWQDPVVWMDAFLAAYRGLHGGRAPRIDALAFHWYDYGLDVQLDRLKRYGKPFWVTELANWHSAEGPRIDTPDKQAAQMAELVAACERRADVERYAWFTGRWSPDPHHTSLLAGDGVLTALGRRYTTLPVAPTAR